MLDRKALEKLVPELPWGRMSRRELWPSRRLPITLRLLAHFSQVSSVWRGSHPRVASIVPGRGSFTVAFGDGRSPRHGVIAGLGSALGARSVDFPLRPQRGKSSSLSGWPFCRCLEGFADQRWHHHGRRDAGKGLHSERVWPRAWRKRSASCPALANATLVRQWAGLRILTPDSYPIYARSKLTLAHSCALPFRRYARRRHACDGSTLPACCRRPRCSTKGVSMFRKLRKIRRSRHNLHRRRTRHRRAGRKRGRSAAAAAAALVARRHVTQRVHPIA